MYLFIYFLNLFLKENSAPSPNECAEHEAVNLKTVNLSDAVARVTRVPNAL